MKRPSLADIANSACAAINPALFAPQSPVKGNTQEPRRKGRDGEKKALLKRQS